MRPNVNKKKLFAMLGAAAAVVIAAAVFMTIRRNYEPGYLNSIFQMKNENMPLFLQYAYMYIANNYSNFNCLTQALQQGLVEHTFGLKQLFPVLILGAVCAALTQKIRKSSNPILYLFYAQLALYLALSFFSSWFTVPTTWFWFALTGALYLYVKK